ncbi:MAG: transporter substrate-binding protein [Microvirga sp.]|jgi:polar amino acid transport system substrate-binding protein|nr:transporter substrate-binding protein [Microvirga sp.]
MPAIRRAPGNSGKISMLNCLVKLLAAASSFAVCAAIATSASADQLDRVKQRGKLIVGIKNDYPPFGWLDASGQVKGFEIDLAKFVAKEMLGSDTAVELVPVVASNRIELLNAGRIDLIFATLGKNADRAKVIDFTDEYYMMAGIVLLAAKDTPIKTWEEVKGRKLCGIQGNLYNRTLSEKYGAETVLFTGTAEMFKAFQDNRCEAIAFDGPILQQKISDDAWKAKYKIALDTFDYIPIAGGARKGEPEFLGAVNKAIKAAEAANVLTSAEKTYDMGSSEYVTKRAVEAKAK